MRRRRTQVPCVAQYPESPTAPHREELAPKIESCQKVASCRLRVPLFSTASPGHKSEAGRVMRTINQPSSAQFITSRSPVSSTLNNTAKGMHPTFPSGNGSQTPCLQTQIPQTINNGSIGAPTLDDHITTCTMLATEVVWLKTPFMTTCVLKRLTAVFSSLVMDPNKHPGILTKYS